MTKTEKKFLERLAGHMVSIHMQKNFYDCRVDSAEYQQELEKQQRKMERVLKVRERGLITEQEAVQLMTD